jgi:hypothetical protein
VSSCRTYALRKPQTCRACSREIARGQSADVYIECDGTRHYKHVAGTCPLVKSDEPEPDWDEAMRNYAERDRA